MGEVQATLFQPDFNRSIHVEARPERLSADAGTLLLRSLMDRLGLPRLLLRYLRDPRDTSRITHPWLELLRTEILLKCQGWSEHTDVTLLRHDPLFKLAVSGRRGDSPLRPAGERIPEGLSSQPTLSRLLEDLASGENRSGLGAVLLSMGERHLARRAPEEHVLDLDSLPTEVHGHQPGSKWNGHYRIRCYHPLVLRSEAGVFLAARLREGNVHTAAGGLDFVLPPLRQLKQRIKRLWLRIDAGFPSEAFLSALEAEAVLYAARLKTNAALEKLAAPLLTRPPGRPPKEGRLWVHELSYQAGSWSKARRVVLIVLERSDEQQHLFLDHFFLVTNAPVDEVSGTALLEKYRERGIAEKDFGEWQNALSLKLSSSPRPKRHYKGQKRKPDDATPQDSFAVNEARLLLSLLSANLLHAGAELVGRAAKEKLSRERFRTLLLKAAARVLLGKRKVTVVIDAARAHLWNGFWTELECMYPARGSPPPQALPIAA